MSERRKTVLVVDDDEGMRETLTAVLKRQYRILRASTGEAALQIMEKEDIDLMLLDVRLPGINGFEVLKIIKENYPYVEVIVISVLKELDTAIEAMRYGAYHYISKDFEVEGVAGGNEHAAVPPLQRKQCVPEDFARGEFRQQFRIDLGLAEFDVPHAEFVGERLERLLFGDETHFDDQAVEPFAVGVLQGALHLILIDQPARK